jgi:hypothetical protein
MAKSSDKLSKNRQLTELIIILKNGRDRWLANRLIALTMQSKE